jgi:transglutaminase-like putative cysteine protease
MTAANPADDTLGPILPAALRRFPLAPAEGWISVGFVALMAMTVAWSLDDAAWVLGQRDWGDFYAWAALIAVGIGFAGAKARWPRWVVHLVGAVAAALVLPLMVGTILLEDGGSPGELYRATATSMTQAWIDLGVLKRPVTTEFGHHLLAIGILAWSVGQFASYAVFGHRRPLDAVIVVGIVLLGNMAITSNDQLGLLVIFSLAGLAVLARSHAFDEQTTWLRRRIGDADSVRSLYLRGGAVFIAAAVFGSLVLTASASSAPLAGFWDGFDEQLIKWGRQIQGLLPVGGASRGSAFGFGNSAAITGQWVSSDAPALEIRVPPGDDSVYYWRAVTYDRYDLAAWSWTSPQDFARGAFTRVLQGTAEDPTGIYARREVTFEVRELGAVGEFVFSPLDPINVDTNTSVRVVGGSGWFSALETEDDTYKVSAAVPILDPDVDNGLTENRLRSAGTTYPDEIRRLYVFQRPEQALGPFARDLLAQFLAEVGPDWTPYDLAKAMEVRFSTSREYAYDEDVRDICTPGVSAVDCLAQFKRGYCMQYATAMAMLLREAGVPARIALGFLPGDRDIATGVETIRAGGAHAWVEVWFPGFGWYAFDPTSGRSQTPPLVEGPPVTPAPSVLPSFGSVPDLGPIEEEVPTPNPAGPAGPTNGGNRDGGNTALLVAIAVLLLVGVGGLAFVAWQRGPRSQTSPDDAWRSVARLAGRFGFGPRPQQTVYEYAGSLSEVLPASKPELQTVARAKVETAYGRRELGGDGMRTLRDAQRRLRLSLLGLAFRRRERRRFRR